LTKGAWPADFRAASDAVNAGADSNLDSQSGTRPRWSRTDWATLLRRTFGEEVLWCPWCGPETRSRLEVIACVTDPPVVRKTLRHLGLRRDGDGEEDTVHRGGGGEDGEQHARDGPDDNDTDIAGQAAGPSTRGVDLFDEAGRVLRPRGTERARRSSPARSWRSICVPGFQPSTTTTTSRPLRFSRRSLRISGWILSFFGAAGGVVGAGPAGRAQPQGGGGNVPQAQRRWGRGPRSSWRGTTAPGESSGGRFRRRG
jgi:hypothetical protein